jgi:hypothetical protein
MQALGDLNLLVVDSLSKFLPGKLENDLNSLQQMLDPLQCLTDSGAAVTILHHPRRQPSAEGCTARGHGGHPRRAVGIWPLAFGRASPQALFAVAFSGQRLVTEWVPKTTRFRHLGDPHGVRFHENWEYIYTILKKRTQAATHQELLMDWPADLERPSAATLCEWLNRAYEEKLRRRQGNGRCKDPYRHQLENEDDQYLDKGLILPLKELDIRGMFER